MSGKLYGVGVGPGDPELLTLKALRLIKENGVAILFPYLRSEITLLTTQPGFQPIVLPAVNIAKMFQN